MQGEEGDARGAQDAHEMRGGRGEGRAARESGCRGRAQGDCKEEGKAGVTGERGPSEGCRGVGGSGCSRSRHCCGATGLPRALRSLQLMLFRMPECT